MFKRIALPVLVLATLAGPAAAPALARDHDHDGLPDRWERRHGLAALAHGATADPDHDGLVNRREHTRRTNPRRWDTDRDGFSDGAEVQAGTNPRRRASRPAAPVAATPAPAPPAAPAATPPPRRAPAVRTPVPDPPVADPEPPTAEPEPPVSEPAPAPKAALAVAPVRPTAGQQVMLDASATSCPEAPCTFAWSDVGSEGDGDWSIGSGETVRFTFQVAGTKYLQLMVRDARGRSDAARREVVVAAPAAPSPTPTPAPSPSPTPTPSPTPAPSPSPTPTPSPSPTPDPPSSPTCDRSATTSTLATQIAAATAGQTLCLAAGDYGTWSGTAKAVTLRPQAGAAVAMAIAFDTGDSGFTLDGVTVRGGSIRNGAKNITVRNSTFTSHLTMDGLANANVLLDHNSHIGINSPTGSPNARIGLYWGSSTPSGVTISNSLLQGGDADGVHTGVAVNVIGNEFADICDKGGNHTDNIQYEGSQGGVVRGNYIHATCDTQGITSFDGGTVGVAIEDNVIDLRRAWGIELYSDRNSIVRHNTLRYYAPGCYGGSPCGLIDINRKSQDPAGSGTVVVDNVATGVSVQNGSTVGERHHNLLRQGAATGDSIGTPVFQGGAAPTSWAGFKLATASPGRAVASDGTDAGIR